MGLFDPFKDVKDDELLDEEEIVVTKEDASKKQGDGANVYTALFLYFFFIGFWPQWLCNSNSDSFFILHLLSSIDKFCSIVCLVCCLLSMQCSVACGSKDRPP